MEASAAAVGIPVQLSEERFYFQLASSLRKLGDSFSGFSEVDPVVDRVLETHDGVEARALALILKSSPDGSHLGGDNGLRDPVVWICEAVATVLETIGYAIRALKTSLVAQLVAGALLVGSGIVFLALNRAGVIARFLSFQFPSLSGRIAEVRLLLGKRPALVAEGSRPSPAGPDFRAVRADSKNKGNSNGNSGDGPCVNGEQHQMYTGKTVDDGSKHGKVVELHCAKCPHKVGVSG